MERLAAPLPPPGPRREAAKPLTNATGANLLAANDVKQGVKAINSEIAEALKGCDARDQIGADQVLIELDGTPDKSRLGGNALIATSMALVHAAAAQSGQLLWRYLWDQNETLFLPLPEIQIFGGGAHAGRRLDVQDFMIIAIGAETFAQALDWTAEVYRAAGELMSEAGLLYGVADEGGFWPAFDSNEQALETLVRAIEKAGYSPGEEVAISLDIAATDFCQRGQYQLAAEGRTVDSEMLSHMLLDWLRRYPIVAIEDPLSEDDNKGMVAFTQAAGPNVQIVADDFICTSAARIENAAAIGACNTALIKPNQAGTLSETRAAFEKARDRGWDSIISARSGETEDTTIVHLAVGWGAKQLKVGSFTRSERMAKWNEGLRIADELGKDGGPLPPRESFPWG